MTLGERIKAARLHKNLTQAQLAALVGVRQQAIQKAESNASQGTTALLDIYLVTGVSPRWLARGEGEMLDLNPMQLDPRIIARTHAELDSHFARLAGKEYDIEADPDLFAKAYSFFASESRIIEAGEPFDFQKWLQGIMRGKANGVTSTDAGRPDSPSGKGRKSAKA